MKFFKTLHHQRIYGKTQPFMLEKVHSVYQGIESLSFLDPKIWELVIEKIKQSESLDVFK